MQASDVYANFTTRGLGDAAYTIFGDSIQGDFYLGFVLSLRFYVGLVLN